MISSQDIVDYIAYCFNLIHEYCEFSVDNYMT